MAGPSEYDGKTKGVSAENFIRESERYLERRAYKFYDETQCVEFAAQYLKDAAANWFNPFWDNRYAPVPPDEATIWAAFKAQFLLAFGDADAHERAKRELKGLRQTKSATEYTSDFNGLAFKTGWDNAVLQDIYIDGLARRIQQAMATMEWPAELTRAQQQAIHIDNKLRAADAALGDRFDGMGSRRHQDTRPANRPAQRQPTPRAAAANIAATQHKPARPTD